MAWFVERLLTDSRKLHIEGFNSEMFEYLLTLENKISDLYERGLLTDKDLSFLEDVVSNKTITQIAKERNISRVTASTKIDEITDRLSMYLGGIYTDYGYLEYMKRRYKLEHFQVKKLKETIKGKYKRFYLR